MTDIIERTPEQVDAIAARKIKLLEERDADLADRAKRARSRNIDTDATAKKLLKDKLVTKEWIARKSPEQLRRYVKIACIAYQQDAISLSGKIIPFASIVTSRSWNR